MRERKMARRQYLFSPSNISSRYPFFGINFLKFKVTFIHSTLTEVCNQKYKMVKPQPVSSLPCAVTDSKTNKTKQHMTSQVSRSILKESNAEQKWKVMKSLCYAGVIRKGFF